MTLTLDKTRKYDRQLRLWGDIGQIRLENAKVCLIGSSCIGSEILKNLVLPGIGKITIVDDAVVTDNDLSNNFFVSEMDMNQSRAAATARLLSEMNDEVAVSHIDDSVESLLTHKPEFFLDFSVVVACDLNNRDLVNLDRLLYPENIGLIVCYSLGMIANLRVIIREHHVFDSRPDVLRSDLRLDRPLDELVAFCDSQNLDAMTHKDIAHCPWLVVLYKYLQRFQEQHGRWPDSGKDKQVLRDMIKTGTKHYQHSKVAGEDSESEYFDSFDEAVKAVSTALSKTQIPSNVISLTEDPRCLSISKDSRPLWVLIAALRNFTKSCKNDVLPLRGDIPDMTADTDRYIRLQTIYRDAAERDAVVLERNVKTLCQTYQIPETEELTSDGIRRFARNCAHVQVLSSCSLERELKTSPSHTEDLVCAETDEVSWYLTLRACVSFYTREHRWPGEKQSEPELDLPHLKRLLLEDLNSCGKLKGMSVRDEFLLEMCRYRGLQLHSVCAFMGGVAAQEVIKLITGQYVPVIQPLIYNAISHNVNIIEM